MKKIDCTYLIDDDKVLVFGAKRILKKLEFCETLRVFENGLDAIQQIESEQKAGAKLPDVILLDINMPIMDGWQFLDEFVKIPQHQDVQLFILTSSVDVRDTEKAGSYSNVQDYLLKPVTINMFKDLLARCH